MQRTEMWWKCGQKRPRRHPDAAGGGARAAEVLTLYWYFNGKLEDDDKEEDDEDEHEEDLEDQRPVPLHHVEELEQLAMRSLDVCLPERERERSHGCVSE
ncbi:unnamed protein product [Phytophthora fragariaefolia]|uniref:Unnamed protein product n=1 Tax=Phytophthora fragariaefolia TaxID=1490495 RepID=A0A9W6UF00_9STRA|nr:unnamed protein product [Phytophthora fragariaefolia]